MRIIKKPPIGSFLDVRLTGVMLASSPKNWHQYYRDTEKYKRDAEKYKRDASLDFGATKL